MKACKVVKTWAKTSVQNLVRHKSGRYYARTFSGGNEKWTSLRTDILEVAKAKLREHVGEADKVASARKASARGKMSMGDCALIFAERVALGQGLPGRAKKPRKINRHPS